MRNFKCLTCDKEFYSEKFDKNRVPKFCCKSCFQNRDLSQETRLKMAEAKKGKIPWNKGVNMWQGKEHPRGALGKSSGRGGDKCHFWKGGITNENMLIRKSSAYSRWRQNVFIRDNFTCILCKKKGGRLNADHIMPFSTYPDLRFDINNGRTLCRSCHLKTDTYGGKMHKKRNGEIISHEGFL